MTMFPHVPSTPLPFSTLEQAWQGDPQALLQQTPSAQNPLKQSPAPAQLWPLSFLQTPLPSQDCVAPEHVPTSSWFAPTNEQTPSAAGRLHALHVSAQAVLQQRPSTQCPLRQSVSAPQALLSFDLHAPRASHDFAPLQTFAGLVSSIETRTVQVPAVPIALQVRHAAVHALSQHTPSAQKPLTQSAASAHVCPLSFLQTPLPSHALTPMQVGVSSAALGTFEHLPALAATLQALQVSLHAVSQQTPSTQNALKHSAPAAQTCASAFMQSPAPLQTRPPFWLHANFTASGGFEGTPAALQSSFVH